MYEYSENVSNYLILHKTNFLIKTIPNWIKVLSVPNQKKKNEPICTSGITLEFIGCVGNMTSREGIEKT